MLMSYLFMLFICWFMYFFLRIQKNNVFFVKKIFFFALTFAKLKKYPIFVDIEEIIY